MYFVLKYGINLSYQTKSMKTLVLIINRETREEKEELIFNAAMQISSYLGSDRIGDAVAIQNRLLEGEIFETDSSTYYKI